MFSQTDTQLSTQLGATGGQGQSIIAIGGGKGGIGKSLIAANLGVHLATNGRSAVLVDADFGGSNLHTCIGIRPPEVTLSDFVNRKVELLEDVVSDTGIPGLGLISGALDVLGAANPKYTQKLRLLREIARLDVDYVIVDLGGGTGFNTLDFFLIADHGILTVVPEPTSIENTYRFIKAAYYRRLKTVKLGGNTKSLIDEVMREEGGRGLKTPADLVTFVGEKDPDAGDILRKEMSAFPLKLVVNQVRCPEEHQLGASISAACKKYFGVPMEFLGSIPYDDSVWQSVRKKKPVVLEHPHSEASLSIKNVAKSVGMN